MAAPLTAGYRESVLWRETVEAAPVDPSGAGAPLPSTADVVVVGGGYCGMAAAAELARRGRHAVVVEQGELGGGASSRNGGMVIPELKLGPGGLMARYGELGRRMQEGVDDAFDLVEKLVAEGLACDYERSGLLLCAHNRAGEVAIEGLAGEHRAAGRDAAVIRGDALVAALGSRFYRAAFVMERTGGLHPAKLHAGLAHRASAAGAELHPHTTALAVDRHRSGGFTVQTDRGEVRTSDVFLATNAYADRVLPPLRRAVLPMGSFIIATEVLPPDLAASVIPSRRMCFDTKQLLWYWRLDPDGRLLFGGRKGLGRVTLVAARDHLYAAMLRVYPQLAGVRVDRVWGGLVALTFDRMPHCGRMDEMWFATGCNGSGVALNTWMGHHMAGAICGERLPPFAELPVPAVPLHWARRAYLPAASQWLRWRDRRP